MADPYQSRGGSNEVLLRNHVERLASRVEPDREAFFVYCNQRKCEYLREDAGLDSQTDWID